MLSGAFDGTTATAPRDHTRHELARLRDEGVPAAPGRARLRRVRRGGRDHVQRDAAGPSEPCPSRTASPVSPSSWRPS